MRKFNFYIKYIFKILIYSFIVVIIPDIFIFKNFMESKKDLILLVGGVIFISISILFSYRKKTRIITIDNKECFVKKLKGTLDKIKWELIREENNIIFINPELIAPRVFGREIIVKIYDNKVQFTGAKSLIDGLIWDLDNL
ncbi:hypothetical protein DP153_00255 [Clostridium tetani]|uniref:Uncharacterized protein n=1 Tax=Clostridium tetani (strain Massachusetts / E88) TaxID=212717 RepID=Q89A07_CLOTE|nr:hypothetical protein [Clostridium tetani]AAO37403.1 hypothetical protein CTC_p7 [Clostridium tetani E88]KGI36653.1 hypothetical protein KY52_13090 [Clostridium tetani]KHO30812.1 hypothetical protein OR63_13605 [Clostridium tetani]KIG19860.1 hypothetical protein RS78_12710 [Clostridium tetani]RXI61514.1 hypothetical protein DP123_12890 [Clostridium tetani]